MFKKNWFISVILIFQIVAFFGCHSESHQNEEHLNSDENSAITAEPIYFDGTGSVISIPPSKRNVVVEHEEIPGFMNAMTMPFSVRDTSILAGISPNDKIRFSIEVIGNTTVVTDIEIIID